MSNNLPQQFQDRVRDRMKEVIGDLIPDEAWQNMVDTTIKNFLRDDLPNMIKAELTESYRAAIKAEISKDEWQSRMWDMNGPKPTDIVKEITAQLAPDMVAAMFGGIVQSSVNALRNQLQNGVRY